MLPWQAAFEILAGEDRRALGTLRCKDSFTAFMRAMLRRAELAVELGETMIETLVPLRDDLVAGFSPDIRADGRARRFAADLLGRPLAVGISGCTRERRQRELRALIDAAKLDRVWSPLGRVYSVPAVRKLLRNIPDAALQELAPQGSR